MWITGKTCRIHALGSDLFASATEALDTAQCRRRGNES